MPAVPVADTLGAGDILHGALTHHLATQPHLTTQGFVHALHSAALVASHACTTFGTRTWMHQPTTPQPDAYSADGRRRRSTAREFTGEQGQEASGGQAGGTRG